MNTNEIKTYMLNNTVASAVYFEDKCIYRKKEEPKKNILAGKFNANGSFSAHINGVDVPLPLKDDLSFEVEVDEVTDLQNMFNGNRYLKQITKFPSTSKVKSMYSMFWYCISLNNIDFSSIDTSNVTNMGRMFAKCSSLSKLDLSSFDTSNVTDMTYMFWNTPIKNLDLSSFDTSKVENMSAMFESCSSLTSLNLSGFNFINVKYTLDLSVSKFLGCSSLTTVNGPIYNLWLNIDLSSCPLTNSSAMVFINGTVEVASTKKLTFKSTTFNTLTEEQIAIATSKGWSVISA